MSLVELLEFLGENDLISIFIEILYKKNNTN